MKTVPLSGFVIGVTLEEPEFSEFAVLWTTRLRLNRFFVAQNLLLSANLKPEPRIPKLPEIRKLQPEVFRKLKIVGFKPCTLS